MRSRAMVVMHDLDEVAAVEQVIADLVAAGTEVHVVSTDDAPDALIEELSPRRLRLMLLLARLADRGVLVTGEDAALADPYAVAGVIGRVQPDEVRVPAASPALPMLIDAGIAAMGIPVLVLSAPAPQQPAVVDAADASPAVREALHLLEGGPQGAFPDARGADGVALSA